jgi:hypothetical protein
MARPCPSALWHLLAVYEDFQFVPSITQVHTRREDEALIDNVKFYLKDALYWVRSACPAGTGIPSSIDWDDYEDGCRLLILASEYDHFVAAYTYASYGVIGLDVSGKSLVVDSDLLKDSRFEAYDRLIGKYDVKEFLQQFDRELQHRLKREIGRYVEMRDGRFRISTKENILAPAVAHFSAVVDQAFTLPPDWSFTRFSLGEFRRVFEHIGALALIQYLGRHSAAALGAPGLGISDCLLTLNPEELASMIQRRTSIRRDIVSAILSTLTYGSYPRLRLPDPALQPLIPIDTGFICVPPMLVITSNPERNLIALANRVPAEQAVYDRLKDQKETLMRERILSQIKQFRLRSWSGKFVGKKDLPDVDLVLIDDNKRACLVLELKWFVEPAEAREVIQRSEELATGVHQALEIKRVLDEDSLPSSGLGISGYRRQHAVVSANSIGMYWNQNLDIPIINERHLVRKLLASGNLVDTIDWLNERGFLPREGVHYKVCQSPFSISGWSIEWYAIEPLVDEYLPL